MMIDFEELFPLNIGTYIYANTASTENHFFFKTLALFYTITGKNREDIYIYQKKIRSCRQQVEVWNTFYPKIIGVANFVLFSWIDFNDFIYMYYV